MSKRILLAFRILCAATLVLPSVASAINDATTADIGVRVEGPREVDRGRAIELEVIVLNTGPAIAEDVNVELKIPLGLSFERAASDSRCTAEDGVVTCSFPQFPVNEPFAFPLVLRSAYQDSCSYIEYTFQVSAEGTLTDPQPLNNVSAPWRTAIRCVPRPPECSDEVDNDRDQLIDMEDPGCESPTGDYERRDSSHSYYPPVQTSSASSSSSSRSSRSSSSSSVSSSRTGANQNVRVSVDSNRSILKPGDTFPITIRVHNPSDVTRQDVTVVFSYSPSQLSVEGGDHGQDDGRTYTWTMDLQPNQTRALRLSATVLSSVPAGTSIVASAKVQQSDGPVSSLVLPVAVALPETGVSSFTSALEASFLSPIVGGGNGLWLFLVLIPMAVVAGGVGMRKAVFKGKIL